jgi:hypothetical protein
LSSTTFGVDEMSFFPCGCLQRRLFHQAQSVSLSTMRVILHWVRHRSPSYHLHYDAYVCFLRREVFLRLPFNCNRKLHYSPFFRDDISSESFLLLAHIPCTWLLVACGWLFQNNRLCVTYQTQFIAEIFASWQWLMIQRMTLCLCYCGYCETQILPVVLMHSRSH